MIPYNPRPCPTCDGSGQVPYLFGTCPVTPTMLGELSVLLNQFTAFTPQEMEILLKLVCAAVAPTEDMQDFGYDEAESIEENERIWKLHYQAGIKSIHCKHPQMSDNEYKDFLNKLTPNP